MVLEGEQDALERDRSDDPGSQDHDGHGADPELEARCDRSQGDALLLDLFLLFSSPTQEVQGGDPEDAEPRKNPSGGVASEEGEDQ